MLQEQQVILGLKALKDLKVRHKVLLDLQDLQVQKEILDLIVLFKVLKDHRVLKVLKVHKVLKV
jgi:hypothetical protein